MLIQTSSPRPMFNASENPAHIRIQTLRKPKVSNGEVALVVGENRITVEPYVIYPIQGETAFEALDYYLPFWLVFGTNKPVYDEEAIRKNIENKSFKRVTSRTLVDDAPDDKLALLDAKHGPVEKLTGVQLALIGSSGYKVITRSAFRTEGSTYEERTLNFTIHCPVNGGGMLRVADCPVDIANPTFNPYQPLESVPLRDLVLQEAFNRTHRLRTSSIDDRRRQRILEAEANMRASNEAKPALPEGDGQKAETD